MLVNSLNSSLEYAVTIGIALIGVYFSLFSSIIFGIIFFLIAGIYLVLFLEEKSKAEKEENEERTSSRKKKKKKRKRQEFDIYSDGIVTIVSAKKKKPVKKGFDTKFSKGFSNKSMNNPPKRKF